jgi:peptidoglycan/LPS O-acetylase OafA/YrhL
MTSDIRKANHKAKYRPEIDGLRAVAVTAVVLYHVSEVLPGGFVGVDIFFVLSGFLITGLLDRDMQSGRFTWLEFWERRFRRLMPALIVVVLCTLAVGTLLLLPHGLRELGQSAFAQAFGLSNFYFWREAGYFDGSSQVKPLLHTWSLAVEEQFYLLMPAFLWMLHRYVPRIRFAAVCLVLAVSFAWSGLTTSQYPDAAFFLLPARAWELMLGAAVCLTPFKLRLGRASAELVALSGLALICCGMMLFSGSTVFPGFSAAIPCVGTAMVIVGARPETLSHRILSTRPFVLTGKLSYSWYLWHWPVISFCSYFGVADGSFGFSAGVVVITFGIAVLSWRFVEQPFRQRRLCPTRAGLFRTSIAGVGAIAFAGILLHVSRGLPSRYSETTLQFAGARSDRNPLRRFHHDVPTSRLKDRWPGSGDRSVVGDPVIAVIGDSHGDAMAPVFFMLSDEYNVPIAVVTRSATIPLFVSPPDIPADQERYFQAVRQRVAATKSLKHVVLVARWQAYGQQKFRPQAFTETIEFLDQQGLTVWIVSQVPEPHDDVPRMLALANVWGWQLPELAVTLPEYTARNRAFERVVSDVGCRHLHILQPADWFFDLSDEARLTYEDHPLFVDDNHLSRFGAEQLAEIIRPVFEQAAGELVDGTGRHASDAAGQLR